jgi:hypothetical protein
VEILDVETSRQIEEVRRILCVVRWEWTEDSGWREFEVLNRVFVVSLELICWTLAFVGFVVAGWMGEWFLIRENGERSCSEEKRRYIISAGWLCERDLS